MTAPKKNNPVTLRSATLRDAARIAELIHELAAYERLSDVCTITPELLSDRLFGEKPSAECIVAELDGEIVGMAIFFTTFSTFSGKPGLYLEDLFVTPEVRGHGAGKALLLRLAEIARERNYGRLEWAVLNWNAPAIGFYQKLGARPMDTWTVYRVDERVLQSLSGSEKS